MISIDPLPPRPPDLEARISALSTAAGGRMTPLLDGYRPCHDFGSVSELNDGLHAYPNGGAINPGASGCANVWLLYSISQRGRLWPGMPFTVQEGMRVVGEGRVTIVRNSELEFPGADAGPPGATRRVALLVHAVSRVGSVAFATVRNVADTVQVGDVLAWYSDEIEDGGAPGLVRVEEIVAYRKSLSSIEAGLTAEVRLAGPGVMSGAPELRGVCCSFVEPLRVRDRPTESMA